MAGSSRAAMFESGNVVGDGATRRRWQHGRNLHRQQEGTANDSRAQLCDRPHAARIAPQE
jgi:hypothetical protein